MHAHWCLHILPPHSGWRGELNSQFYKPRTVWPHSIGPAKRGVRGRGSEGTPGNEMVGWEGGCPRWGWDFHQAGAKGPAPHVAGPDYPQSSSFHHHPSFPCIPREWKALGLLLLCRGNLRWDMALRHTKDNHPLLPPPAPCPKVCSKGLSG